MSKKYQLEGQQGGQSLMVFPDSETRTLVVHCRMRWGEVRGGGGKLTFMAGYFDAGGGREQALLEVETLGTKTRWGCLLSSCSASLTSPASPSCRPSMAAGRTHCSSPCCSRCRTWITDISNKLSPDNSSGLLFIVSSIVGADVTSYSITGI